MFYHIIIDPDKYVIRGEIAPRIVNDTYPVCVLVNDDPDIKIFFSANELCVI